jgi:hypothetical protein
MFASQVIPELILMECPDRRRRERLVHREPVQIDGRLVVGRDISATGLSVIMRPTVRVGDSVHVALFRPVGRPGAAARPARVVRVDPCFGRFVVGLEFIR